MNSYVEKIAKKIFINFDKKSFAKFFKFWHPETATRYLPVVAELKRAKLVNAKILEIGSGSLGITPYLKREIDGVDIDFSGPQTNLVNKINGSATNLPFRKNSYDVVISVDVLEHLQKEDRELAIYQMLKVAKMLAIIVVPTGKLSEEQDKSLYKHYQKVFRDKNQFLEEHVKNGLPAVDQILVAIDKSKRLLGKKAHVRSYPILNLKIRNILMRTWITKSKFFYYIYLKGYLLLLPILRVANFGNCYRRVFVIEFVSLAEDRSSSRRSLPLRAL